MNAMFDVIIIGGGAAGFFTAIQIAEKNSSLKICILEAGTQVLSKVRISGGGRCNVTHNQFDPKLLSLNYPRGQVELIGPFNRFNAKDTCAWFNSHGVELHAEADGRMFPLTNSSETIIDCLVNTAKKLGIKVWEKCKVLSVEKMEEGFHLSYKSSESLNNAKCKYLVICTGGSKSSYALAEKLGHKIVSPVPSLFSFKMTDSRFHDLSGLSFQDVEAKLLINKNQSIRGPILITHWGLSGPAIIKLSALAARELAELNYNSKLIINFLPNLKANEVLEKLTAFKNSNLNKQLDNANPFNLPKRYWLSILNHLNLNQKSVLQNLSKKQLLDLAQEHSNASFQINGKGEFKEEFVTAGGIDLGEINFKSFESKICKNLFFSGEVLNIDGLTGGFNFQNAWTGAWHIGEALKI